eukprot:CAMPEP_0183291204 /NCGR_PEP_ID=MMETSP0160_2-20130417/697_1 /TAXON_ID=2839 ORGANISM="Odontella Sinensis, Strain Grunow 1884" /NCGR_SAMPLE_ID=MMETSP0160_2 /ASSEMBLY_ACC=CAM_ASM_000250 /LENGTH=91 /DNA_ID=CAMNT_0025451973 /DNA_START=59 /DNA_END=334 /DNA_ORIENTATION=+
MVVLEAAAITAGGYAAYRGGETAVKGAKAKIKEIKLGRKHNGEFAAKKKERKERLARITSMRQSAATGNSEYSVKSGGSMIAKLKNLGKSK